MPITTTEMEQRRMTITQIDRQAGIEIDKQVDRQEDRTMYVTFPCVYLLCLCVCCRNFTLHRQTDRSSQVHVIDPARGNVFVDGYYNTFNPS